MCKVLMNGMLSSNEKTDVLQYIIAFATEM